ncbi:hypothetical protein GY45DRAFT_1329153 [Cubamyces sp. BRFM 1775]|nr:hypothetical protein GY45DRAFT_1329153 [Cubamyces sp. BRFM 1775]
MSTFDFTFLSGHRFLSGWDWMGTPRLDDAVGELSHLPLKTDGNLIDDRRTTLPVQFTAQVHSLLAYAYFKKYTLQRPGDDAVANLLHAVRHASQAANWQFVSRAVLLAGFAFKGLLERIGIRLESFAYLSPLWRALNARERAVFGSGDQRSLETCRMGSCQAAKQDLRRCDGTCLEDCKPKYCSPLCFEKVGHGLASSPA